MSYKSDFRKATGRRFPSERKIARQRRRGMRRANRRARRSGGVSRLFWGRGS